ncbi:hypothetical protein D3C86_1991030 [compost metagenome]
MATHTATEPGSAWRQRGQAISVWPMRWATRLCGMLPRSSQGNQQTTVSMAAVSPTTENTAIWRRPRKAAAPSAR